MSRLLLLTIVMGCAPSNEPEDLFVPSPYLPDEQEAPQPQYLGAEIGDAIQLALQSIYALNSDPLLTAYDEAIAEQDDGCPRYYAGETGYYWFDQCTSETGAMFSGYGFFVQYDEVYLPEDDFFYNGQVISGAGTIVTAAGHTLNMAGYAASYDMWHASNPVTIQRSNVHGTFDWSGSSSEGTWLSTNIELDLGIQTYLNAEVDGRYIVVQGGIAGLQGEATALLFDQFALIESTLGGPCEQEPYGTVSIRGSDGEWYDVIFEGPDPNTFESDASECDGVGHAYFRGELVGDVPVDFSALFQWADQPW